MPLLSEYCLAFLVLLLLLLDLLDLLLLLLLLLMVLLVVMLMMLPWSMILLLQVKGFIALHFCTLDLDLNTAKCLPRSPH